MSATGAKPPSSKTSKSSANSRGSKNSGGQMAETSQNYGGDSYERSSGEVS